MKINRKGVTRIVFLTKRYAIKIPNFTCQWSHFLQGIIGNIKERDCYRYSFFREGTPDTGSYFGKYTTYSDLLCPVIFCSWGGWILIMRKANTERHMEQYRNSRNGFLYADWINNGYGGDDKPENYGYVDGRLVKVDYP